VLDFSLVHVLVHKGIYQNELADTHAKETIRAANYFEVNQDISSCKDLSRDFRYCTLMYALEPRVADIK